MSVPPLKWRDSISELRCQKFMRENKKKEPYTPFFSFFEEISSAVFLTRKKVGFFSTSKSKEWGEGGNLHGKFFQSTGGRKGGDGSKK